MESFWPTEPIAASQLSLVVADATLLVQTPAADEESVVTVHGLQSVVDKAGATVSAAVDLLAWFDGVAGTANSSLLQHVSLVGLDNSLDDGAAGWGLVALR